ncbi:MAG: class II aldolase/adducin family protein [Candidatus Eisenbacteria bacterium]|uniref:Class II aldolase/adducin family protein n=1 Tax=Eiseniibacteriota bacterium TaxID=2212470 RepID=A0A538T4T9_UNCEI|nr:MAG: class II aldolase/adducin family protein [Candidatus Eisenbacteria bacterium]
MPKSRRGSGGGAGEGGAAGGREPGIGSGVGRAAAAARVQAVRTALAHDLMRAGRVLERRGMIVASEGNLSARITSDRILITRRGRRKGDLTTRDFVDLSLGEPLDSQARAAASTEHRLHLAAYAARADIEALVHAHPAGLSAFAVRGEAPDLRALDEARDVIHALAVVPYAPSGTDTLARAVADALIGSGGAPACDVLILKNHGALAVGGSVEEALTRLEIAEHLAITLLLAERR